MFRLRNVGGRAAAWRGSALVLACGLLTGACSVRKFAVRQVGNALSSGTSTFETDPDPDLVGEALPFSLKMVESLLAITPRHRGLLVTAAKGFSLYAMAYVDMPGEILESEDFRRSKQLRERAARLYLRGLAYGLRALEEAYPGIGGELRGEPRLAVARVRSKHVDLLYWTAAALGLAISTSPTDASLVVRLSEVEAMLERAMELDEAWDRGALHEFRLRLEAAKPGGGDAGVMERSFERALALSGGQRAGLFVAYAEARAVPSQEREMFEAMLDRAMAVDVDAREQDRLLNVLAQRRAEWLRSRMDDLFF